MQMSLCTTVKVKYSRKANLLEVIGTAKVQLSAAILKRGSFLPNMERESSCIHVHTIQVPYYKKLFSNLA